MAQGQSRVVDYWERFGPGLLVAATGVGAGDLLSASFAGSAVGSTILWAALVGALFKWVITEGIARWQLATGEPLLVGWARRLGPWAAWLFLGYFLVWSFVVGAALINACGVAGAAFFPLFGATAEGARHTRLIWGLIHSLVGLALVWRGGFRLFEKVMAGCVAVMFFTVLVTACLLAWSEPRVLWGLIWPTMPAGAGRYVITVIGGVGGTVTMLSYGYWIRESARTGVEGLRVCQIDLACGYALTGFFGAAMVLIGAGVTLTGKGDLLALTLAGQLRDRLGAVGPFAHWLFLVGFWAAVFSSLLGVWQGVPYLFADFMRHWRKRDANDDERDHARWYYGYLLFLALAPLIYTLRSVREIQLVNAVLGAIFVPLAALTLLIMNNRAAWMPAAYRPSWLINALLVLSIAFFIIAGCDEIAALMKPSVDR